MSGSTDGTMKERKLKNTTSILRWLWQVAGHLRLQTMLNALTGIITVGLDFSFIWTTKLCIDIATGRDDRSLRWASVLLILIMAAQLLISLSRRWIAALLGVKARNQMQLRLFRRLLDNRWTGREERHTGDILNRLIRDSNDVTNTIAETVPDALSVLTRFCGAFVFLHSMDSHLAYLLALILPVFLILSRFYVRKMRTITRQIRDTESNVHSILQESILHRILLKTLERVATMTDKLNDMQTTLCQQVRHRTVFSSFSGMLLNVGFASGYLVTFLWGANRLHDGSITYGMMLAFIQLVGQIQGPFRDMTKFVPVIISAFTAAERLMELEEVPTEEQGTPVRFPQGAGLRITDVSFRYDATSRNVLSHFTYDFPPGSRTAILGETGTGKTTLIRLILALLHPTEGRVEMYADGQVCPVSALTRCNLIYVPQENTLFSGTIRDNLLLGRPDATEAEMEEVLRTACADFVFTLPDGMDSRIGEGGTGLSQGQAQRVSLARALLRDGSIFLLDEATSALDTETEAQLLQNLTQHIHPHQTLIFITHRQAVVEHCDSVLKMKTEH